jgi:threonine synthase
MAARLRPAKTSNSTARLRPVQDSRNNREHGHFPTAAFRWRSISPLGKMADLTGKSKLV